MVTTNPYRLRYFRLLAVLEDFKDDEKIDNEVLFKYLKELMEKHNYKVN